MSAMAETIEIQPREVSRLLADAGRIEELAARLRGRRVFLTGTGTSWHAANHGAWFLQLGGVDARAVAAMDARLWGPSPVAGDAVVLLSHRGTKRYTSELLAEMREQGVATVVISGRGAPGADLETVDPERSSAFTASHVGALVRLAQLAVALGSPLGDLEAVPAAVEDMLARRPVGVGPPERLLELTGAGPNQWTAAEGALKVRETSLVATEGLAVEQLLHGPLVALGERDALVALDGGGPGRDRLRQVVRLVESFGTRVHTVEAAELGEPLSVFPLTVAVQLIALECAEALGTDPDSFGRDLPGREAALAEVPL